MSAAVVEVLGGDDRVLAVHKVQSWPLTLGRSPDCDLVLVDPHVAGLHARIEWTEEGARLTLLDSLNGGRLDARMLKSGDSVDLGVGARFQLGSTGLRLRSSAQALAPERPLAVPLPQRRPHGLLLPGLILAWLLWSLGEQWLGKNPDAKLIEYVSQSLSVAGLIAGWSALWSLVTQLFRHRFPFALHLRGALVMTLVLDPVSALLPLAAYSLSWAWLQNLEVLATWTGIALLIWWHCGVIWPRGRRTLGLLFAGLLLLGLALSVARNPDRQHWFRPLYLSALPPPALRVASAKPPQALIDGLKALQAELDAQAAKDDKDDKGDPETDGGED